MSNPRETPATARLSFTLTRAVLDAYETALEPFAIALWVEFETTDETVEGRPSDLCHLHLYVSDVDQADRAIDTVRRLAAERGEPSPQANTTGIPEADWAALSQQQFTVMRIGRYVIRGAHLPPPPAGRIDLLIEAGAAFGSGSHPTTAGCLVALERLAKQDSMARVLDMGTGSGILAVAAAKTWRAANTLASDNDPAAVLTASQSARRNGVSHRLRTLLSDGYAAPEIKRGAPYDLIIANILARPLMTLAPALARHLSPGGTVILSGILRHQIPWVLAPHRAMNLRLVEVIHRGAWPTLILTR